MLDLARDEDKAVLAALLAKADVFVQNLKPGAIAKLGFPLDALRRAHPRLVICSISGYGEDGPYHARKAYDMLIQAESGLASLTGSPEAPARVGVSVCDIAAGMNAYEAILEALIARERTGDGAAISISMFDAMADWMAVPLMQYEGGQPPRRMGLAHTSIAPYGVFKTRDGADILISIQSDREWRVLAAQVLGDAALAADPAFATNVARVKRRADTDARVQTVFGATDAQALTQKLAACRHRLCPRQRHRRACRASAAAPHRRRHAVGRGVVSGAGRAPRRPSPPLRRGARARASTAMRFGPSSWRARKRCGIRRVRHGCPTSAASSLLAAGRRACASRPHARVGSTRLRGPSARRAKRNIECTARRAAPGPRLFALARSAGARERCYLAMRHLSHLTSALRCLVER